VKLRETLNNKLGRTGMMVVGGLLLVCVAVLVFSQTHGSGAPGGDDHTRAFFTADDGKTWFPDDAAKLPPFDRDGKQAVRAYVFRSAKGTEFVNHLERFKPDAKRVLEEASRSPADTKAPPKNLPAIQNAYANGREVKRPGDTTWISAANLRAAAQVMTLKPPDAAGGDAVPVEP
jgi:hypothetical protein